MKIAPTRAGRDKVPKPPEGNKLARLQKEVGLRLSIIAGGVVLLGIAALALGTWHDNADTDRVRLNVQIGGLNAQIQQMQADFEKARKSIELYDSMKQKTDKGVKALDRQEIVNLLGELKRRNYIVSLEMEMTPIKALKGDAYASKTSQVLHSIMRLKFDALTDEFALRFLEELVQELPGYVRPEQVTLERSGKVDEAFIMNLSKGDVRGLVKGSLVLHLLSLEKTTAAEGGTANAQ